MRLGSLPSWVALGATILAAASGCGGSASQSNTTPGGSGGTGTTGSGASGSGSGASGSGATGSGSGGTTSSSGGSATSSSGTAGEASGTGGTSAGSGDSGAGGANGGSGGEPSSTEFPGALSIDVWVVGWAGDLDHYSWVRFTAAADGTSGTWQALDATCSACTGYLLCKGAPGTWSGTKSSGSLFEVTLVPPIGCTDQKPHVWKFVELAESSYPRGAELATHLQIDTQSVMLAERYPSSACNPAFTACAW